MTALIKKKVGYLPHVVDIFGNIKGRDQPIMKLDKAIDLINQLDSETFTNDEYVFFDPFCKSGEILLASALVSLQHRSKRKLLDLSTNTVFREMFESNRYFAMAPDERHYRLSLRTFYGNEKSHDPSFTQNIKNGNYLSELDGRLNKDKFNKELQIMINYIKEKSRSKKIIAVGNPPYQENSGGYGKQAIPIYNLFIDQLIEKVDQFSLVIPARWFSGGMGLRNFRAELINSNKIRKIKFFENSNDIFPTVDIRGGVCYLLWDNTKKSKKATFEVSGETKFEESTNKYDVIVPRKRDHEIIDKIIQRANSFISSSIWPLGPFGLPSNYFDKKDNGLKIKRNESNVVECFTKGRKIYKIPIKLILKNRDKINEYKIAFPKAVGGGRGHRDKVLPRPEHFFIMNPGQISTFSYGIAGSFKDPSIAQNFMDFLRTNFARFLLSLRKSTQDMSQKNFAWVPKMDFRKKWTDESLFKYFEINEDEKQYIKNRVQKLTA